MTGGEIRWSPKAFLVLRLCDCRSPGPGRCGGAGVSPWWRPVCRWIGSPGVSMMSSPMRMESAQTASHWTSAEPLRQAMALRTEWRRSFPGWSCCSCKVPAQLELLALFLGSGSGLCFAPKTALDSTRDRQWLQVCVWFLQGVSRGLNIMNNKSCFGFPSLTVCKALFL